MRAETLNFGQLIDCQTLKLLEALLIQVNLLSNVIEIFEAKRKHAEKRISALQLLQTFNLFRVKCIESYLLVRVFCGT